MTWKAVSGRNKTGARPIISNISNRQKEIAKKIGSEDLQKNWRDWRWQLKHSVRDLDTVERLLGIKFSQEHRAEMEKTTEKFPISVTPYYLSLIDAENYLNDPVFRQSIPNPSELISRAQEMADPLAEDRDSPAPLVTHRYPDRVLFHISNTCSMYCRHCTRKRKVGDAEYLPSEEQLQAGLDYIRNTPVVRDVLLSGGDPFMLSNDRLEHILTEVRAIPHVEVIRIGTRMPVVLPFRVTDELVAMLRKFHPLWINTHFNHPRELTASARESLAKLADAGFPLGNQSVLLAGVNDCPRIMKSLVHRLVKNRVRPYYMYQCDLSEGLDHFRTPVGKGIEIMENLIGHTSGFAVPTYVIDAPGGGGKIPVMPTYLISWSTNRVVLRNYEGVIASYKEPDFYEANFCDRNCAKCNLELKVDPDEEYKSLGIASLLADYDETIALTPEDNERYARRDQNDDDEEETVGPEKETS